ncbi:MAG TPA: hypothetical protein VK828_12980 [Terriglobales bacterium]|jgi:hypothetical protein|nr:hypothetical protein [Terriglobales bacterium]
MPRTANVTGQFASNDPHHIPYFFIRRVRLATGCGFIAVGHSYIGWTALAPNRK